MGDIVRGAPLNDGKNEFSKYLFSIRNRKILGAGYKQQLIIFSPFQDFLLLGFFVGL